MERPRPSMTVLPAAEASDAGSSRSGPAKTIFSPSPTTAPSWMMSIPRWSLPRRGAEPTQVISWRICRICSTWRCYLITMRPAGCRATPEEIMAPWLLAQARRQRRHEGAHCLDLRILGDELELRELDRATLTRPDRGMQDR